LIVFSIVMLFTGDFSWIFFRREERPDQCLNGLSDLHIIPFGRGQTLESIFLMNYAMSTYVTVIYLTRCSIIDELAKSMQLILIYMYIYSILICTL